MLSYVSFVYMISDPIWLQDANSQQVGVLTGYAKPPWYGIVPWQKVLLGLQLDALHQSLHGKQGHNKVVLLRQVRPRVMG